MWSIILFTWHDIWRVMISLPLSSTSTKEKKKKKVPQLPLLSQAPGILELEKCSFSLRALFTLKGKCPKVARRRGTPASARRFRWFSKCFPRWQFSEGWVKVRALDTIAVDSWRAWKRQKGLGCGGQLSPQTLLTFSIQSRIQVRWSQ